METGWFETCGSQEELWDSLVNEARQHYSSERLERAIALGLADAIAELIPPTNPLHGQLRAYARVYQHAATLN